MAGDPVRGAGTPGAQLPAPPAEGRGTEPGTAPGGPVDAYVPPAAQPSAPAAAPSIAEIAAAIGSVGNIHKIEGLSPEGDSARSWIAGKVKAEYNPQTLADAKRAAFIVATVYWGNLHLLEQAGMPIRHPDAHRLVRRSVDAMTLPRIGERVSIAELTDRAHASLRAQLEPPGGGRPAASFGGTVVVDGPEASTPAGDPDDAAAADPNAAATSLAAPAAAGATVFPAAVPPPSNVTR